MGSQPSIELGWWHYNKNCTMPDKIFIYCNNWECCPVPHSLAVKILWSRHDSNYMICHHCYKTTKPLFIFIILQYSRTNLQCSEESKVKTGLTDHLMKSYKVSYRADLESYEDLIRLSVRRFLSQISSSVPWLTITAVGLCEWIRFVENHTSAYPVLGNHNHHGQRHCHQTLRADWCYGEAWDWKYFGGDEGGSPRHLALAVFWLLLSSEQGTSYFI